MNSSGLSLWENSILYIVRPHMELFKAFSSIFPRYFVCSETFRPFFPELPQKKLSGGLTSPPGNTIIAERLRGAPRSTNAPVAQLDRASASGAEGRAFESRQACQHPPAVSTAGGFCVSAKPTRFESDPLSYGRTAAFHSGAGKTIDFSETILYNQDTNLCTGAQSDEHSGKHLITEYRREAWGGSISSGLPRRS